MPILYHFYHLYADGDWKQPVEEHIEALNEGHLMAHLVGMHVGFVGSPDNVAEAKQFLTDLGVLFHTCAETVEGFEQETLDELWRFSFGHGGYTLYTHTKGASRVDPIDTPWRRSMEYHNVVNWRTPVDALVSGKAIAGCHWIRGNPEIERLAEAWKNRHLNPPGLDGVGGMFGGNFWWAPNELIRRNVQPTRNSRFDAEHWLGQLSEVVPINEDTICDLNPHPIVREFLAVPWEPRSLQGA